jgi:hypothetical protein
MLAAFALLLVDESCTAEPMTIQRVAAPVRLPAVAPSAAKQAQESPTASVRGPIEPPSASPGPLLFQPIADRDFRVFEPAPAVELDLGLPKGSTTRVGGWVEFGYHGGVIGQ